MKKYLKELFSSAVFLLGFHVVMLILSLVFVPKSDSAVGGMHDYSANNIASEPEQSIDVLFLGDSLSYFSLIPLQIWEEHGITSYGCGTSAQLLNYSEKYLHKVFEHQSPKVVVLEANTVYRKMIASDLFMTAAEEAYPVVRFHHRWKTLSADDFNILSVRPSYPDPSKGYYYTNTVTPGVPLDIAEDAEAEPLAARNRAYLEAIRDYCSGHGAELVLLHVPNHSEWTMKRHNGVAQLAAELGLKYVDMNLMPEEVPIDWTVDSFDGTEHLNYSGAVKVTRCIGNYLASLGVLTDHRSDSRYMGWEELLSDFKKNTQVLQ